MSKIYQAFVNASEKFPSASITVDSITLTLPELLRMSKLLAGSLEGHVFGRSRVGLSLPNSHLFVIAYLACLRLGSVPFLLDPSFGSHELEAIARTTGLEFIAHGADGAAPALANRIFASQEMKFALSRLMESSPKPAMQASTELCRFTSGTTGIPKCLEFSGTAVVRAAETWVKGTRLTQRDRILCLASMSNGLAFNTSLLACFLAGADLFLCKGVLAPAYLLNLIEDKSITRLIGFPAFYRSLCLSKNAPPEKLRTLNFAISAGAKLWPWVKDRFQSTFGAKMVDYYGIAETGPVTFELESHSNSSLGKPLPDCSLKVEGDGEGGNDQVLVKTPSMATCYLNFPGSLEASIDASGYYRTGDSGYLSDGQLFITGRLDSRLNIGGRKIDPNEVLEFMTSIPGVKDAVLFSHRDEPMEEERLILWVEGEGLSDFDLIARCRSKLAPYKVPGRIFITPNFPRNGIGKPILSDIKRMSSNRKE